MGWQDDARRLIVSEQKDLTTFPGFWIKAKKFSINAKDEINAATREVQKGLDKKAILEVTKKAREAGLSGNAMTEEEIIDALTPEQLSALIDSTNISTAKVVEIKLRNGIEAHNFEDTKVAQLAHDILEYPEIAQEMLKFVEEFNRPLAKPTSVKSATLPSGSTEGAPLSTEILDPMEASQPSS